MVKVDANGLIRTTQNLTGDGFIPLFREDLRGF